MSDFIFSSRRHPRGQLSSALFDIYTTAPPSTCEYHGPWGSLAVTKSTYQGFDVLETKALICVVIGQPALHFVDNAFASYTNSRAGTQIILDQWISAGITWDEDLSGPFVVLIIDKAQRTAHCITDLMMFIPVYQHHTHETIRWSTHVDALANVTGQQDCFDDASLTDFVLNHVVTYPHTVYKGIQQCAPASIHKVCPNGDGLIYSQCDVESYWEPLEHRCFNTLEEAAAALRGGVQEYIHRIIGSSNRVAQFISAGEDSRVLAGMLPMEIARDAYIFLDSMNREGKIAQKVAASYGATFTPFFRSSNHYLEILPEASRLVGSGHQYIHAHSMLSSATQTLSEYHAVFGGYIADSLLKGLYTSKRKLVKGVPLLPEFPIYISRNLKNRNNAFFLKEHLEEMHLRRKRHLQRLCQIRPHSADEWFELWPATMRAGISNLYVNRRLFASHEIFMAKESVKVAAASPIGWKLNRRLFHRAFHPALVKAKLIMHPDGRLPYYSWWLNSFIQPATVTVRTICQYVQGKSRQNEGPWGDWRVMLRSSSWEDMVRSASESQIPKSLRTAIERGGLDPDRSNLPLYSKINLLQSCFQTARLDNDVDTNPRC